MHVDNVPQGIQKHIFKTNNILHPLQILWMN